MEAWWLFPFVGGLIGWLTNFLAIKMIFHPRDPVLGIQGLIPRRRRDLAQSIGQTVSTHLVHKEDILKSLPIEELKEEFTQLVGQKVDLFIEKRFMAANPMLSAFISDEMKLKIRQGVMAEMEDLLPHMEEKISLGLENHLDMKSIVVEKIENFDTAKLEKIVLSIAQKELRAIEFLGGLLGALVGLGQYGLIHYGIVNLP